MSLKNEIILFDKYCSLESLEELSSDTKIISFDNESHQNLKKSNIDHLISDSFLTNNDFNNIDEKSFTFSSWYSHKEISPILLYDDINLGELFFTEFFHFLNRFLKKFLELKQIYKKYSNSIFYCSEDLQIILDYFSSNIKILPGKQNKTQKNDIDIKFKLLQKDFNLKISKSNYNKIQNLIESSFKLKKKSSKTLSPVLLTNFSTDLFRDFISLTSNSALSFVKYDRISPSFWNLDTYNLLKQSNCFIENQKTLSVKSDPKIISKLVSDLLSKLEEKENLLSDFFVFDNERFWSIFKPFFFNFYKPLLNDAINEILITKKLFSKYSFSAVMILQETRFHEQIIIKLAKKNSIPILQILHGFFSRSNSMLKINKFFRAIPFYSDTYLVWGKSDEDYLSRCGLELNKIQLIGSPIFDKIFNNKIFETSKFTKFVLFATDFLALPESKNLSVDYNDFCKSIITNTQKTIVRQNFDLLIKPHPNKETIEKEMTEQLPRTHLVSGDPLPFIKSSDVVIVTDNSTLILESLALGKPVISIKIKEQYDNSDLFESGACVRTEIENLPYYLDKILNDVSFQNKLLEKRKIFLKDNLENMGIASDSILKYLEKRFK